LRAYRRNRAAHAASQRQCDRRRPANGRNQPRRQARLLDQLAVFDVGRPVLSGRRARRASDGARRSERRPHARRRLLGRVSRRLSRAPDPARRRRLLDRFILLPVGGRLTGVVTAQTGLWLAVLASGLYHGLNPAMGWPLAVSNALMQRRAP